MLIHGLLMLQLCVCMCVCVGGWVSVWSMFCYVVLCVFSSLAIILMGKRERASCFARLLSYRCIVTINVMWLFLTVPWVGLQSVIVAFPYHTH